MGNYLQDDSRLLDRCSYRFGALNALTPSIKFPGTVDSWLCISFSITAGLIILLYISYRLFILREGGITTSIVLGITYLLGFVAGSSRMVESLSASILVTFILALKFRIRSIVGKISYPELSALEIGIMVFVVGPFIPSNDPFLHLVNIKSLYVFFVIILVLSYVCYVVLKLGAFML
ncbi:MAG TPA: hypothetical protein ENG81_03665 [Candidatus Bathyarchaeota archaeon]|nr:hypothetical protein [Candidatus Bathyarchaeota archaeon]